MAQVTTKIVVEGLNNLVLHATLLSNGFEGELNNYVLLDPITCTPSLPQRPAFRIMQIWYSMVWFDITLKYGASSPRPVWTLARDTHDHIDFRHLGGLSDYQTAPPSGDRDGHLLISTNGFAQVGSQGALVIELRKP